MKHAMKLCMTVMAMGMAGVALAQQVKPEDAIRYRQGVMAAIGWHAGPMGAMVKGERPFDKALFARNAERIAFLSQMPLEGFIPGSESGDTKAKPEIWLEWDKFKNRMERMQKEAAKLVQVAKTGDEKAMKTQFGELGKACKACHDDYREK